MHLYDWRRKEDFSLLTKLSAPELHARNCSIPVCVVASLSLDGFLQLLFAPERPESDREKPFNCTHVALHALKGLCFVLSLSSLNCYILDVFYLV